MKNYELINKNIHEEFARTKNYKNNIDRIIFRHIHWFTKVSNATTEEDMFEGFDYSLTITGKTIAVRIRRPTCIFRDFTIRYPTEYNKIKEGKGDMYLYAWTSDFIGSEKISEYWIIDLNILRSNGFFTEFDPTKRIINNTDGTKFTYIKRDELVKYNSFKAHEYTY